MSDLIDRHEAIEAVAEELLIFPIGLTEAYDVAENALSGLPSVEPRKKGKWKGYNDGDPNWQRDDGSPMFLICSECHETVINGGSAHWNFCPNCGADMRGEQNENQKV